MSDRRQETHEPERPIPIPEGSSYEETVSIALRYILEHGVVHWSAFGPAGVRHLGPFIRSNDRLAHMYELTAAGHRRLAELDDSYKAPLHAVSEMEHWNDVEALAHRVAALVGSRSNGKRAEVSIVCEPIKDD